MRTQEAFRLLIFNYIACLSIALRWTTPNIHKKFLFAVNQKKKIANHFSTQNIFISCSHLPWIEWKYIQRTSFFVYMFLFVFNLSQKKTIFVWLLPAEWTEQRNTEWRNEIKRREEKEKSNSLSTTNFWRNSINRPNSDSKLYKFLIESYLLIFFFSLAL